MEGPKDVEITALTIRSVIKYSEGNKSRRAKQPRCSWLEPGRRTGWERVAGLAGEAGDLPTRAPTAQRGCCTQPTRTTHLAAPPEGGTATSERLLAFSEVSFSDFIISDISILIHSLLQNQRLNPVHRHQRFNTGHYYGSYQVQFVEMVTSSSWQKYSLLGAIINFHVSSKGVIWAQAASSKLALAFTSSLRGSGKGVPITAGWKPGALSRLRRAISSIQLSVRPSNTIKHLSFPHAIRIRFIVRKSQ